MIKSIDNHLVCLDKCLTILVDCERNVVAISPFVWQLGW